MTKKDLFLSEFVVLDIETTGLSEINDKIIEVAAIKIKDRKIIDKYTKLINPEIHISSDVTKIHGITDEMVAASPKIEAVLPEYLRFIGNQFVIAHNAPFDIKFIKYNAELLDLSFDNYFIYTLSLARKTFPYLDNHKLPTLIDYLKLEAEEHHRAYADTLAVMQLYFKCIDILKTK